MFRLLWAPGDAVAGEMLTAPISLYGPQEQHNTPGQWQQWQAALLKPFASVYATLTGLGSEQSLQAAAGASAAGDVPDSSGSSSRPVKWGYLKSTFKLAGFNSSLHAFGQQHLQADWQQLVRLQPTPTSAAAAATPESASSSSSSSSSSSGGNEGPSLPQLNIGQMYADAIQLCRGLTAAVPLPLVCNNPSCRV
jgi:hypothetical protein